MRDRRFNAFGGWSTLFTMSFFGYAAHHFDLIRLSPIVTPFQSPAGIRSIVRNTAMFAAPALVGMLVGIGAAGDSRELWNLFRNGGVYKREFKAIHHELHA